MFYDATSNDDSSLLIQCNFDCIIEKPSYDEVSFVLPSRQRSRVPPPRPGRSLDYIQVFYDFKLFEIIPTFNNFYYSCPVA